MLAAAGQYMAESGQCSACHSAEATLGCACADPPLLFCESCFLRHTFATGSHRALPISRRPTSDGLQTIIPEVPCDECTLAPATQLCLCTAPYVKFCESCDVKHYQKADQFAVHSKHPVDKCHAVLSGAISIETFKAKQAYISNLRSQLLEDLANFNAFQKKVVAELDSLEELIRAKKESIIKELEAQRPKLEAAVNTALQVIKEKRYLETFEANTYLDDYILNGYRGTLLKDVRMLKEHIDTAKLDQLFHFEVDATLLESAAQFLPVLTGNNVRIYNPITKQLASTIVLDKPTRFHQWTAYCQLGKVTILCCGGENISDVYEVNVKTSAAEKKANMSQAKGCVGLWNYKQEVVFAFGGWNAGGNMDCAEKFSLSQKIWTSLRSMCRRAHWVSVCEHSTGLYFTGENSPIQHFNIVEESFSVLYSQPASDSPYVTTLLFCVGDDLYQIRQDTIEQADLSRGPVALIFTPKATFPKIGDYYWTGGPVKRYNDEFVGVLGLYPPAGLFSFNPTTLQFTKVLSIVY